MELTELRVKIDRLTAACMKGHAPDVRHCNWQDVADVASGAAALIDRAEKAEKRVAEQESDIARLDGVIVEQNYSNFKMSRRIAELELDNGLLRRGCEGAVECGAEWQRKAEALEAENARMKKAILSFGNGTDFDWNVLGRIDELEEEVEGYKAMKEGAAIRIAELEAENARMKKAILSFGNGTDFDWNVLGRIDDQETMSAVIETLEILRDPDALRMLQESIQDIKAGRLTDHEDLKRSFLKQNEP